MSQRHVWSVITVMLKLHFFHSLTFHFFPFAFSISLSFFDFCISSFASYLLVSLSLLLIPSSFLSIFKYVCSFDWSYLYNKMTENQIKSALKKGNQKNTKRGHRILFESTWDLSKALEIYWMKSAYLGR